MKTAPAFPAALISALLLPSIVAAQVFPHPVVVRAVRASAIGTTPTRARAPEARVQDSTPRFQMIGFKFWTGGDDLRDDSAVKAVLVFPDRTRQECRLHGSGYAAGAAANISWDNNSTHDAAPCSLATSRTLAELKRTFVFVLMTSNALSVDPMSAVAGGPVGAAASLRTNDNWDIARVDVTAYNPDASGGSCVVSVSGNPLARLTGSQPSVNLSAFPNQCP